jgi:hypothetical protein
MRSYFAADVKRQIIGVTPVLPGATRHDEIIQHLQSTNFNGDYLVIDDDPGEFPTGWPPLLLCNPNKGFDVEKQGELRRLLNKMQTNTLLQLSAGTISLIDATANLGVPDAGHTLHTLREAGLAMPQLTRTIVQAQSRASLAALRSSITDSNDGQFRGAL